MDSAEATQGHGEEACALIIKRTAFRLGTRSLQALLSLQGYLRHRRIIDTVKCSSCKVMCVVVSEAEVDSL